jgi:hypothetical protein
MLSYIYYPDWISPEVFSFLTDFPAIQTIIKWSTIFIATGIIITSIVLLMVKKRENQF